MSELCMSAGERARKAQSAVLSRLQDAGSQTAIAAALGISEATVSRIKNERLAEVLSFLYAAGFKLVSQDKKTVSADALEFMRAAAARVLTDPEQWRAMTEDET